jgi:hypothetical protein
MPNKMRNPYAVHIDFEFLYGVIPENPKAQPSNVDMMFERKGKFLVGEWKRTNENMNLGQKILLEAFAKKKDFIVIIIEGHSVDGDTEVKRIYRLKDGKEVLLGEGIDLLKNLIIKFYRWANR